MKKTTQLFLFIFLFNLGANYSKAQYVTIPDANFANWLNQQYPGAMNGNLMDTTNFEIVTTQWLFIQNENIADLTGLNYFDNLLEFLCYDCQVTNIPSLPPNLEVLNCTNNFLSSLPPLPSSLTKLIITNNYFSVLPNLPNNLIQLSCDLNQLNYLPMLPANLVYLECAYNQLTSLPALPNTLTELYCNNNQISSLPPLTNLYTGFWCNNNNISCFPIFPSSLVDTFLFDISNNPYTCVPNYVGAMNMITLATPLCSLNDPINNPNQCQAAYTVNGLVYQDSNLNCSSDISDQLLNNIKIEILDSVGNLIAQTHSLINGAYNFTMYAGNYHIRLDTINKPYTVDCAFYNLDTLVALSPAIPVISNIDFPIVCKPGFDIGVQSVVTSGIIFPGQPHQVNVVAGDISAWYGLSCSSGISGQVEIIVNGPVTFEGPAIGALTPIVNTNVFIYNVADFGLVNILSDFNLMFLTDTTAQAGDTICITVNVTPNTSDHNISNNTFTYCYSVSNSFDPNMKEVYPINVPPAYNNWLTYTIHFQNTGNAPAINIRLLDTLDNHLDFTTFELLNYSHPNNFHLNLNVLNVRFNNISLPDSASNQEGSKGYFQYRIKPKANQLVGTEIRNTAYIYFDFNAPIVTNTTVNSFVTATSKMLSNEETISIYPNPNQGIFNLETNIDNYNLNIYNMLGELVYDESNINSTKKQFDLSMLNNGVYFVKVVSENKSVIQKLAISAH